MTPEEGLQTIRHELESGVKLTKCQRCGCMENTLNQLASVLPTIGKSLYEIIFIFPDIRGAEHPAVTRFPEEKI
jgi:hypothetical protein